MKKFSSTEQNHSIRLWLAALVAISALIMSNCGGTIQTPTSSILTSTPTAEPLGSAEPVGPAQPGEITAVIPTDSILNIPTEDPKLEPTATLQVEDVCSVVTAYDVEKVLGETVTSIVPGADPDKFSDSTLNFCTFRGSSDKAVIISSVEVENGSIGLDMLRSFIQNSQDEEPDTKTQEELGVGIKAFWSVSEHAGGYTALTEEHIFSVVLGGNIGDANDHKADLLTLAQTVAEKQ